MGEVDAVTDTLRVTALDKPCVPVEAAFLSVLTPAPVTAGDSVTFRLDVAPVDITLPYSYTINFGDQAPVAIAVGHAAPVTFTHIFTDLGTYLVNVEVWNCAAHTSVVAAATVRVADYDYLPVIWRGVAQ